MDKRFKPEKREKEVYKAWEESGLFSPKPDPKKEPFTIIMPPPNANGRLHVGHALFATLQDIMIRYHRMLGDNALWVPGADHAGIATQVSYEKKLAEEGKSRFDLGREKFYQEVYEFSQENKKEMYAQLKALGASCDWEREKFTLDPEISHQVLETFVELYEDGKIYRGERLINWCPRCQTTLADLEVEHEQKKDKLWYIKYPLVEEEGHIVVATTRPETMLGDTAIAVNPKDKRYKKLVGKSAQLPLVGREIPIVADPKVDMEFGTGAVKVTPAHDPTDAQMGKDHDLETIKVIGFDDKITKEGGEYSGMEKGEAREKIVSDLEKEGLLEREEDYTHSVGVCERCSTVIEPLVSMQWFVEVSDLAKSAIKAVKEGKVKFVPPRFKKIYFQWMENIHDWPVSRQLWWGHRIPVWYCGTKNMSDLQKTLNNIEEAEGCGEILVSAEEPEKCPNCENTNLIQDPDTLDTWFSSGQWPFNILGYPKSEDFKYFYPTSVLETGHEIIFLWVARMVMFGLYKTGEPPFHTVYLHGIVKDREGKKMSKSKGNVIDPLEMIGEYGADALRMSLVVGTTPGNDMSLSVDKIVGYRNFANKVWNIARFTQMMLGDLGLDIPKPKKLNKEDKKFLDELAEVSKKTTKELNSYRFSQAGERLYDFIWHRLADVYIEEAKDKLRDGDPSAQYTLATMVKNSLIMLHPFMPFVTESVWGELGQKNLLLGAAWPKE